MNLDKFKPTTTQQIDTLTALGAKLPLSKSLAVTRFIKEMVNLHSAGISEIETEELKRIGVKCFGEEILNIPWDGDFATIMQELAVFLGLPPESSRDVANLISLFGGQNG